MTIDRPRRVTAKQMLSGVIQGNPYRTDAPRGVLTAPPLTETEYWEYELALGFVHKTLLGEVPDKERQ